MDTASIHTPEGGLRVMRKASGASDRSDRNHNTAASHNAQSRGWRYCLMLRVSPLLDPVPLSVLSNKPYSVAINAATSRERNL